MEEAEGEVDEEGEDGKDGEGVEEEDMDDPIGKERDNAQEARFWGSITHATASEPINVVGYNTP